MGTNSMLKVLFVSQKYDPNFGGRRCECHAQVVRLYLQLFVVLTSKDGFNKCVIMLCKTKFTLYCLFGVLLVFIFL